MEEDSIRYAWMTSWHGSSATQQTQRPPPPQFIKSEPARAHSTVDRAKSIDEPYLRVPPTPTPSEEVEWSPARPPRAQVEASPPNRAGSALVRNNNTAVVHNTFVGTRDLDPLAVPPPSKSELRQRTRRGK